MAVSGGSDSVALLHLAARWAAASGRDLVVYTVDHGLRPDARAEAEQVGRQASALNVPHRILTWAPPDHTRSQAAFRDARHRLLAGALRGDGGQVLLMGHTQDDQAETFLIRARAGSGWYGLAGMPLLAPSPVWPEGQDIAIGRPLLKQGRAGLRAWLRQNDISWIDDPSNKNPLFERVRVRTSLAEQRNMTEQIATLQQHLAELRAAEDIAVSDWLVSAVRRANDSTLTITPDCLSEQRLTRGLNWVLLAMAGADKSPRSAALKRLASAIVQSDFRGATLGGCQLDRAGEDIRIVRETAIAARPAVTANQALLRLQWIAKVLKTASITTMC